MTMGDLYQRTIEKKRYLEGQGYVYVGKWECEFDRDKTFGDDLRVSDGYISGLIDIWIQGGYIDV
jgi:hypothetical protein